MAIQYKAIVVQNGIVQTPTGPLNIPQLLDLFGQHDGELVSVTAIAPGELLFVFKHAAGQAPPGI